jgi:hypothetical protein
LTPYWTATERIRAPTNGLIAKHRSVTERALADAALRYVTIENAGLVRAFMPTHGRRGKS